jgi:hypothetical protein
VLIFLACIETMATDGRVQAIQGVLFSMENGIELTRVFFRRRPETYLFKVILQTRELVWTKGGGKIEGASEWIMSLH